MLKERIQRLFNRFGYNIRKYPEVSLQRRMRIIEQYKFDTIIDVGANTGQYALELRNLGYQNRIISFEPTSKAYDILNDVAKDDPNWITLNFALGDKDECIPINISNISTSSSLLRMNDTYKDDALKEVYYKVTEQVEVKRLDSIFHDYIDPSKEKILLKVDAQGYENKILDGATASLHHITAIQIELSLVELYKGESLFLPMLNRLDQLGFEIKALEQGFYDPKTLTLYQVDGIFIRKDY